MASLSFRSVATVAAVGALALVGKNVMSDGNRAVEPTAFPACPQALPLKNEFSACVTQLKSLASDLTPEPIALVDYRSHRVMVDCRLSKAEQLVVARQAVLRAGDMSARAFIKARPKLGFNWQASYGAQVLIDSSVSSDGLHAAEGLFNAALPTGTCPRDEDEDLLQARTMYAYNPG